MKKFFIGVWCTLLMSVVLSCSGSKPEIETALDEEGLYILDFQPVGELPTAVKYPSIYVQFSQPVVAVEKLGTPSDSSDLMKIEPAISGVFRWYGTSLLCFDATEAVIPQREYTVTLSESITSVEGNSLTGQRIFTFKTEELQLKSITPGYEAALEGYIVSSDDLPVEEARSIALYFSYPVTIKEISKYVRVVDESGTEYDYTMSYPDENNKNLVAVKLKKTPPENTKMTVVLQAEARSDAKSLGTSTEDASHSFHTLKPFSLVDIIGSRSGVSRSHPVVFQFSHMLDESMDKKKIAEAFVTSPAITITEENIVISGSTLTVQGLPVDYEQTFSITLNGGVVSDIYGRVLQDTIGPKSITVPAATSYVAFKDYGFVMLENQFAPKIIFSHQNILPGSSYTISTLDNGTWQFAETYKFQQENLPKNQLVYQEVDLGPFLTKGTQGPVGTVKFDAEIKHKYTDWRGEEQETQTQNTQYVQVTDLGLTVRYGFNKALVLVTSLSTGNPVEGATVGFYASNEYLSQDKFLTEVQTPVVTGVTDKNGLATLYLENVDLKNSAGEKDLKNSVGEKEVKLSAGTSFGKDEIRSVFFSAEKDGDKACFQPNYNALWGWGATTNPFEADKTRAVTYMFTDRGLYKPGEKVRLGGLDRNLTLGSYENYIGNARISVRANRWGEEAFYTQDVTVSQSGSFNAEFTLPEDIKPGSYIVEYTRTDSEAVADGYYPQNVSFTVAYFERLRFESSVTIPALTYYSGDNLSASLSASYLGGGSLAGSNWWGNWYREPTYFRAEGRDYEDMAFGPIQEYDGRSALNSLSGTLDGNGSATGSQLTGEEKVKGKPYEYIMEASVTDSGGQSIAARESVVVHPAYYYLGLSGITNIKGFPKKGDKISFDYALVTPESQKPADTLLPAGKEERKISYELLREDWKQVRQMGVNGRINTRYEREIVTEDKGSVDLAVSGIITVTPSKGGAYILRVSTTDKKGREVITERSFYVSGSDWNYFYYGDATRIEMMCDKETYEVGDTAQIIVQSPLPAGTYVMTIEREGIFSEKLLTLTEPTTVLELPITDRYLPVAYVTLSSYSVRTKEPEHTYDTPDLDKPKGYFGATALHVSPEVRRFDVEIVTDKVSYRPGDEVTVTLKATKAGQPLAGADLTLVAVDRGVLDLINYHIEDPLSHFYDEGLFLSGVQGGDSRSLLIDPVTYEVKDNFGGDKMMAEAAMNRGVGMGSEEGLTVRSNFDATAVFAPGLITGKDGTVTYTFTLPDNLTEYRVTAVGSLSFYFGLEEAPLIANNPLSARDVLPRKLRVDDVSDIGVVISNLDGIDHTVSVSMDVVPGVEATGEKAVTGGIIKKAGKATVKGETTKSVTVPASRTVPVLFDIEAEEKGFVSVSFTVRSDVLNEKIIKPLEIEQVYVYETVTTVGEVTSESEDAGSVQETIILPSDTSKDSESGLTVVLDPTRLGTLTEAVNYVFRYPYGCLEQRVSAMLPLVYFGDYIDVFGMESEVTSPQEVIETELLSWAEVQNPDGGFPYWRDSSYSSLGASLRFAELLAEVMEKEYAIPDGIDVEKLKNYIATEAKDEWYKDNVYVKTYSAYVLSKLGETISDKEIDSLKAMKGAGFAEKAMCGLMYLKNDSYSKALEVAQEIKSYTRPTTRGLDITNPEQEGYNWLFFNNDSQRNAFLLMFFTSLNDGSDMPGRLLFNLLQNQRASNGYWQNTATTGRVLESIAMYIEANNLESLDFSAFAELDGERLAEGSFKGVGAKPVEEFYSLEDLQDKGAEKPLPLVIEKTGEGDLFYTVSLKYDIPVEEQIARDEGLSLSIEYTNVATGDIVDVRQLKADTVYKAKVTLSSTRDRTFVAMRVPIPAGAEILDATFGTTPQLLGAASQSGGTTPTPYNSWFKPGLGYSYGLSSRVIYDSEVQYFWDMFPKGFQQVEFMFRPVRNGEFILPSATAECMYEPEIFGRTQGYKVTISQ